MPWNRKRKKNKGKSIFNYLEPQVQKYFLSLTGGELKNKKDEIESAFKKVKKLDQQTEKVCKRAEQEVFKLQKHAEKIWKESIRLNPKPKKFLLGTEVDISLKDLRIWEDEILRKLVFSLNKVTNFYRFNTDSNSYNFGNIISAPKILHDHLDEIFQISYDQYKILRELVPYDAKWLWDLSEKANRKIDVSDLRHLEKESTNVEKKRAPAFVGLNNINDLLNYSGEIKSEEERLAGPKKGFVRRWELDLIIRHFQTVLQAMPEISSKVEVLDRKERVKRKNRERSATLAAYEDKSRNVGQSLMKRMREEVSLPFYCNYCSQKTLKKDIHIDHINPVSNGGLSVERNLIPICKTCNLEKKDLSLRKFSKSKGLDYEEICDRLENQDKFV